MFFAWLKRFSPRGLYGRAALILILPVVTLQLVVSVVFIQRHFEGVTRQMTQTAAREVELLLQDIAVASTPETALEAVADVATLLQIVLRFPLDDAAPESQRRWYDLSGLQVIDTFDRLLPRLLAVRLPDDRNVLLYLDTPPGVLEVTLDRRRVSPSNPHQLFVNMVFFGGLMTLIAFIYLRNQLRPITRLAQAAEAFGKGRTVTYRPSGAVEVRAAGNAFLDMRNRIERQIEQRTLMLSGVSHDLRTPLTRLKLGLSMLDDADAADLKRDVDEMQSMLDEFLNFARGISEAEPEPVDPAELLRDLVEDFARAGKAVSLVAVEGRGTILLRRLAMRRAVENLITNAVRYGSRAEVSMMLTEKSLRIRVEDDGPGIPPAQRSEAVKPFTRLDAARNQNKGSGVGLGLAIATDIARAHGGVLRLGQSERLGGLQADIVIAR
ncbi:ATP-binding protein [Seohaeicola sp. SP36]|uniref:ATP-binding protein n=1 Tax=unclassified Seohaeicola TaxID=2641111 RepID=UPI00237A594C|nr:MULTISPECIES: ATP-binding protein [unclassified Seohaeicola]MDD9707183.1 ATP-binding protein [Seohaeicola sp. 4SK31]MDD9735424.1 ATP-binding protein [Seohaeicola sp. SP36]